MPSVPVTTNLPSSLPHETARPVQTRSEFGALMSSDAGSVGDSAYMGAACTSVAAEETSSQQHASNLSTLLQRQSDKHALSQSNAPTDSHTAHRPRAPAEVSPISSFPLATLTSGPQFLACSRQAFSPSMPQTEGAVPAALDQPTLKCGCPRPPSQFVRFAGWRRDRGEGN